MIKIIDSDFNLFDEFKHFCKCDSFGTRIYSHFLCYGYDLCLVDFWVQISGENKITAAICKFENDVIVSMCDDSQFQEIYSFLNFINKSSVMFDNKYAVKFDLSCCRSTGDILIFESCDVYKQKYDVNTPQLKEYHNLLLKCESDDFFVPEYMSFLSDVSRRKQRGLCEICGVYSGDDLASCAMTVSYTDFSVILGAVATDPRFRKRGFGGCVVGFLADKFIKDRIVYIYTTVERNTRFYESLGFKVSGKWIKYTYGG